MSRAKRVAAAGALLLIGAVAWMLGRGEPEATPEAPPEATPAAGKPERPAEPARRTRGLVSEDGPPHRPSPGVRPVDGARVNGEDPPGPPPNAPQAEDTDAPGSVWPVNAEGFRDAVAERLGDLHDCYETWLQTHPELSGKVVVSFTLANDGDVSRPTAVRLADSTLQHTPLEGCVMTIFEELRFEPTNGAMAVTWPILFSNRE